MAQAPSLQYVGALIGSAAAVDNRAILLSAAAVTVVRIFADLDLLYL